MSYLASSRTEKRNSKLGLSRRTVGIITPLAVGALIMGTASTCSDSGTPGSDSTPPKIYILKWNGSPATGRGSQATINSGGQFTIDSNWLGESKADIRVYADDDQGSKWAKVTGNVAGAKCSSLPDSHSVTYQAPGLLSGNFNPQPPQQDAPSGSVRQSFSFHLDDLIEKKTSCGEHKYANMTEKREFFASSGTWTITAEAENCCGGRSTATFTIIVPSQ
ncbi:hypothetical protein ACFWBF_17955 [Streptomyces sp. NPDC060028]|uniref:hypothetical protein n=1 Tax=Streptomyces sp. NPDC060028 TaxID=3347041 RepID=UPI003696B37C